MLTQRLNVWNYYFGLIDFTLNTLTSMRSHLAEGTKTYPLPPWRQISKFLTLVVVSDWNFTMCFYEIIYFFYILKFSGRKWYIVQKNYGTQLFMLARRSDHHLSHFFKLIWGITYVEKLLKELKRSVWSFYSKDSSKTNWIKVNLFLWQKQITVYHICF